MREPDPSQKPVSLNDLLKANREQFDKIFGSQQEEMGLLRASRIALTEQDLGSASLASTLPSAVAPSPGRTPLGADSDDPIASYLNEMLGDRWRYEVIEQKTVGGGVTVLCKLAQNAGTQQPQFFPKARVLERPAQGQ